MSSVDVVLSFFLSCLSFVIVSFRNGEDVSPENIALDHNSQNVSAAKLILEVRKTVCSLFF